MDIKKELASNKTVLLVMPGSQYNDEIVSVMKKLKGNICYVTANKTFDSLEETFKKKKVNTDRIVFITGMIRSGSTLLARMLDAYPRSAIVSDPYFPIFKAIRNTVAEQITGTNNIDYNLPLEDYYFYPEKQKIMEGIQGVSLDLPIRSLQLSELRQQIAKTAYLSQKIVPFLDDLRGHTAGIQRIVH